MKACLMFDPSTRPDADNALQMLNNVKQGLTAMHSLVSQASAVEEFDKEAAKHCVRFL